METYLLALDLAQTRKLLVSCLSQNRWDSLS